MFPDMEMPAITLHQPWASLIAYGFKWFETRSWAPPAYLIGQRIAIHAAARPMREDEYRGMTTAMNEVGASELYDGERFQLGVVVCTAVLAGAYQVTGIQQAMSDPEGRHLNPHMSCAFYKCDPVCEPDGFNAVCGPPEDPTLILIDEYGDFGVGRWLWELDEVELVVPPVRAKGYQRFWRVQLP